ncbi:hypothetical protein K503DRAFT_863040 [Rhizopogon vinicolor AM-OR11-026]|uniref:F-box domain-containing protein n=1 Tax=Rhizopogon vinicolor AM-OR11-026 TaxID=1314800 RepID=A0A1B7NC07_9AGAM|nr:hypothetical protein K503DRAFT_863040 [Rhizopogon vinicolor AM-OR11-026]
MTITLIPTAPGLHLQSPSLSIITSPTKLVHAFKSPQSPAFPDPSKYLLLTHHLSTKSKCSPPPSPRLPPELFLHIISFLTIPDTPSPKDIYDPSNLTAICHCSLVNIFWLHASREYLWRYVRLGGGRRGKSFVKLLQHYTSGQGSTLPTFAPYVKRLSVRESRGESWDPKWLNAALPTLAGSFPNLYSLEAERITLEYLSSKSRSAFMEGFKGVRNLALGGCEFRTTLEMIRFIGEFEDVESLTLDGVRCDWDDIHPKAFGSRADNRVVPRPPRKLRELAMRGARTRQVLKWIRMAMKHDGARAIIQVLRLGALDIKSAPAVGKFLKTLGPSLKELHLGFDATFIEDGDEIVSHIDLGYNNGLKEMHVYGLVIPSLPPPDPSDVDPLPQPPQLIPLTALLSRVCAPSARVLSMALHPADLHALVSMDFAGLSDLFDSKPWTSLENVQVVVANEDDGNMGRSVEQKLAGLFERGVLRVDVGFDDRVVVSI